MDSPDLECWIKLDLEAGILGCHRFFEATMRERTSPYRLDGMGLAEDMDDADPAFQARV